MLRHAIEKRCLDMSYGTIASVHIWGQYFLIVLYCFIYAGVRTPKVIHFPLFLLTENVFEEGS